MNAPLQLTFFFLPGSTVLGWAKYIIYLTHTMNVVWVMVTNQFLFLTFLLITWHHIPSVFCNLHFITCIFSAIYNADYWPHRVPFISGNKKPKWAQNKKLCVKTFQIGLRDVMSLCCFNFFSSLFSSLSLHSPVHQHPEEESVVKIILCFHFYFPVFDVSVNSFPMLFWLCWSLKSWKMFAFVKME